MKNINAFLKFKFLETDRTLEDLSSELNIDKGYLSRIFNNVYTIKKERNLIKICNSLNVDIERLNYSNLPFEQLLTNFYNSVFFISENRDDLFDKIKSYKEELSDSPYILDILLAEYVYLTIKKDFSAEQKNLEKSILSIINACSTYNRNIFYTYQFASYDFKKNFTRAFDCITLCSKLNYENDNLTSIFYYHCFSYYVNKAQISEATKYYYLCKNILEKNNNTKRLVTLNIIYSNYLVSIGLIREAIQNNTTILDYLKKQNKKLRNIGIIYNNIAFCYFLLEQYDKAEVYYEKTLEHISDNEIYFCLALSCFRLNKIDKAKLYIKLGHQSSNAMSHYYKLLDWLDSFIKKAYSKKTSNILLNILDKDKDSISAITKRFIYYELSNYYSFHKDFETAYMYSKLLLETNHNSSKS